VSATPSLPFLFLLIRRIEWDIARETEDCWINYYRFSRHPSYTGFFYWAVATQVLLGNVISVVGFVYVLAKFFEARIIGGCRVPSSISLSKRDTVAEWSLVS
jgi:uncharacterized membrane protein